MPVYLAIPGVWFGGGQCFVSGVVNPYPNNTTGFAEATKTSRAAKLYWRILPVLKWTSGSDVCLFVCFCPTVLSAYRVDFLYRPKFLQCTKESNYETMSA